MADKPITFFLYAIFGVLLASLPIAMNFYSSLCKNNTQFIKLNNKRIIYGVNILYGFLILYIFIIFKINIINIFYLSLFLLFTLFIASILNINTLLLAIIICLLGIKIIWWDQIFSTGINRAHFHGALIYLIVFLALGEYSFFRTNNNKKLIRSLMILIFIIASALLSFSTALYSLDEIRMSGWHHWSAFIGPAELMMMGGRIFFDFPAQYGLGPTSLIAFVCQWNCWSGMYFIVGTMNFFYSIIVALIILRFLRKDGSLIEIAIGLSSTLIACFFYTAYPPALMVSSMAPSVGGLRFLPCVLMLAFIVCQSGKKWGLLNKSIGVGLWALGFFWSPEAAFQTTFLWGSFFYGNPLILKIK